MKFREFIILILIATSILLVGCLNQKQEVEHSSTMTISHLESEKNSISTQSTEQSLFEDVPSEVQVKDCEYKAMQTVVNIFGQMEISDLGEYDFQYFTDRGADFYNDYKEMFKDKKLLSLGTPNGTESFYWAEKDKICTTTWVWYKDIQARTTFHVYFIKQGDKWLVDSIELDS